MGAWVAAAMAYHMCTVSSPKDLVDECGPTLNPCNWLNCS